MGCAAAAGMYACNQSLLSTTTGVQADVANLPASERVILFGLCAAYFIRALYISNLPNEEKSSDRATPSGEPRVMGGTDFAPFGRGSPVLSQDPNTPT